VPASIRPSGGAMKSRAWFKLLTAGLAMASLSAASGEARAINPSGQSYTLIDRSNVRVGLSGDGRRLGTYIRHATEQNRRIGSPTRLSGTLITRTVDRREMRVLRAAARQQLRLERRGLTLRDRGLTHGDRASVREGEALLRRASAGLRSAPIQAGGTSYVTSAFTSRHFDVLGRSTGQSPGDKATVSVAFAREAGTSKLWPTSVTITRGGLRSDGSPHAPVTYPVPAPR
jgi:hypothetical protein